MYIINKYIDPLFAGALSVLLYAIVYFFNIDLLKQFNIAEVAFFLAFIVNHPHFISSYFLFYKDEGDLMAKSKAHFTVGVVVPFFLIGVMLISFLFSYPVIFGWIINILYFTVGFHYVRQTYGVSLISLAKQKIYLSSKQKWALNLSMYPTWFVSFLNGHNSVFTGNFYGLSYNSYKLPHFFSQINTMLFVASILVWIYVVIFVYTKHKHLPLTLIASLSSIALWHFPFFYNQGFFYLIALFHSLQYLLIVAAVKKNKAQAMQDKKKRYLSLINYSLTVVVVAYLAFHFIPETLDKYLPYDHSLFGASAILGAFLLFINLHHYAMDALLWRKGSRLTKYV